MLQQHPSKLATFALQVDRLIYRMDVAPSLPHATPWRRQD
jgi:hypothetical protein